MNTAKTIIRKTALNVAGYAEVPFGGRVGFATVAEHNAHFVRAGYNLTRQPDGSSVWSRPAKGVPYA
jgi:hypothetical protein